MKQSTKIIAVTILFTAVATSTTIAQQSYTAVLTEAAHVNNSISLKTVNVARTVPAANSKTEARFAALFPNASNLQWIAGANNYWVSFLNNGRKANASFTAKGKMNYLITVCAMEDLPAAFSKIIQKEYAAYRLFNAFEIKAQNAVTCQAILEDDHDYITLNYTIDGVEKIQQVKKL